MVDVIVVVLLVAIGLVLLSIRWAIGDLSIQIMKAAESANSANLTREISLNAINAKIGLIEAEGAMESRQKMIELLADVAGNVEAVLIEQRNRGL